ncbi:hypothetical protein L3X38_025779 [Prunus dulcis]|uniref:Uncharacterized protein n=1 Tax=Prunus dulcis TaxID=3755 RepID=A0AAD4Z7P4_PRUDU|nr:hypothetical protein L3X38_025779 [Prunus dulcis]
MWYRGWFGLEEWGGGGRFGVTMGWGFDGGWKDVTIIAGWRWQLASIFKISSSISCFLLFQSFESKLKFRSLSHICNCVIVELRPLLLSFRGHRPCVGKTSRRYGRPTRSIALCV